jgi:ketosteroid isomerase-like protein
VVAETAREVYLRFLDLVAQDRWDELHACYAEDAVVEQPYARPEPGLIVGREALRERFAARQGLPLRLTPQNVVIHETLDPEVVVAEFDYDVTITTTGEQFRTANVILLRISDGLIRSSRDFHDVGRITEAVAAASA